MNKLSNVGLDSVKLDRVLAQMLDGTINIHAVAIERQGQTVVEQYRPGKDRSIYGLFPQTKVFGPTTLHDTRSVGKSVLGLLIGIALKKGEIQSLHIPVMDFYPEYAGPRTPGLERITLEHFLTMSSGLEWNEGDGFPDDEHHLYWKWSPVRYVLNQNFANAPGEKFNYNSGGTAVLADVLTRVTKSPFKDFAREFLFEPLDIHNWEWIGDLYGRPMAFTGLRMCTGDMLKIGRLTLNHGQWLGRQIVPADWISASLQTRMHTGFNELQYGYHWWVGTIKSQAGQFRWGAAFGNGGQRIYVLPELDMTIVITAGAYGDAQISRILHAFFKDIISTIKS